jgi:hypothetical protein
MPKYDYDSMTIGQIKDYIKLGLIDEADVVEYYANEGTAENQSITD